MTLGDAFVYTFVPFPNYVVVRYRGRKENEEKTGKCVLEAAQTLAVGFYHSLASLAFELAFRDSVCSGCFVRNPITEHFTRKGVLQGHLCHFLVERPKALGQSNMTFFACSSSY
jgi:hypothetical protein